MRSILVGLATLVVVGFLLFQYQRLTSVYNSSPMLPTPVSSSVIASDPGGDATKAVELLQQVSTTGGDRPQYMSYHPDTGDVRFVISATQWRPVRDRGQELEMDQPIIRFRTPAGQWVRVTADRGLMEVKRGGGDELIPLSGRLNGRVQLEIDRLSSAEREALPVEERDRPGPERLIRIEMENILFNLEYATLESTGPFKLTSVEADVEGRDLSLRYNELDSRIELLKTSPGGKLVVRGFNPMFRIPLPTAEPNRASDEAKKRRSDASKENSRQGPNITVGPDGVPIIRQSGADVPRSPDLYSATFEGPVAVEQHEAGEISAQLAADLLEILFNFGAQQRGASRKGSAESPADKDESTGRPATELHLSWSGSLTLQWQESISTVANASDAERFEVTARGQVRMNDRQGQARCGELFYDGATEHVRLRRSEEEPFRIESVEGASIVAESARFDRAKGDGEIIGPGSLVRGRSPTDDFSQLIGDPVSEGGTEIYFQDRMRITMARPPKDENAPSSNGEYIETAEISGQVRVLRNDMSIQAERVALDFGPPLTPGAMLDNMRTVRAYEDVVMTHGPDRTLCQSLAAQMSRDETGRLMPYRVEAKGSVSAMQGGRSISAADEVNLDLVSVAAPKPPFDLAKAKALAVAKGKDPATVDWGRIRNEYEKRNPTRPVLSRITAFPDVAVEDPHQGLSIRAAKLDAHFDTEERITSARVEGNRSVPAQVQSPDYRISGEPYIDLSRDQKGALAATIGDVIVPGSGSMSFQSQTGLDGRRLAQPANLLTSWTEGMEFHDRGDGATALFRGKVHAAGSRQRPQTSVGRSDATRGATAHVVGLGTGIVLFGSAHAATLGPTVAAYLSSQGPSWRDALNMSAAPADVLEENIFDCQGRLEIEFVATKPDAALKTPAADWWVLTPIMERFASSHAQRRGSGVAFHHEPVTIAAEGKTTMTSTAVDEKGGAVRTRNTIQAQRLYADLRSELISIEDAGTLMIEDYWPTPSSRGDAASLFDLSAGDEESQTLITWSGSLRFHFGLGRVEFRDAVRLQHFSGEEMRGVKPRPRSSTDRSRSRGSQPGGHAELRCELLTVEFGGADGSKEDGGEADRLSIGSLNGFSAQDNVFLDHRGTQVFATQVTYGSRDQVVRILGSEALDAQIHSPEGRYIGPKLTWNLRDSSISTEQSQIIRRSR